MPTHQDHSVRRAARIHPADGLLTMTRPHPAAPFARWSLPAPRAQHGGQPAPAGRGNTLLRQLAVQRMQDLVGNRATRRYLQPVPHPLLPVQRTPTFDLDRYHGTGPAAYLADFKAIQALLSNRGRALIHLEALSRALDLEANAWHPTPQGPNANADRANEILDVVLRRYERYCGFSPAQPILAGFASAEDFQELTRKGQHFRDVGAGQIHGEYTHRIQWFIIMREVTAGFTMPRAPGWTLTPLELYQQSMNPLYAIESNKSPTGQVYMWDQLVDRIGGDEGGWQGSEDAWTHPGEQGAQGALSNDILTLNIPEIAPLKQIRQAQVGGHEATKKEQLGKFEEAKKRGQARGQEALVIGMNSSSPRAPTYFYENDPQGHRYQQGPRGTYRPGIDDPPTSQDDERYRPVGFEVPQHEQKAQLKEQVQDFSNHQVVGQALKPLWDYLTTVVLSDARKRGQYVQEEALNISEEKKESKPLPPPDWVNKFRDLVFQAQKKVNDLTLANQLLLDGTIKEWGDGIGKLLQLDLALQHATGTNQIDKAAGALLRFIEHLGRPTYLSALLLS